MAENNEKTDQFLGDLVGVDWDEHFHPTAGTSPSVKIGQPVWYVKRVRMTSGMMTAKISETYVSELKPDGCFSVFNPYGDGPYLTREAAKDVWCDELTKLKENYQSWVQSLEENDRSDAAIDTMIEESREKGCEFPSWLLHIATRKDDGKEFNSMIYPEPRFYPGQVVFGVAEEATTNIFGDHARSFQVYEMTVKRVSIDRYSKTPALDYDFDCTYRIKERNVFATLEEAEARRIEIIKERIQQFEQHLGDMKNVLRYNNDQAITDALDRVREGDKVEGRDIDDVES